MKTAGTRMIERWKNLGASLSLGNFIVLGLWNEFQDTGFDYFRKIPSAWYLPVQALYSVLAFALIGWVLFIASGSHRSAFVRKTALFLTLLLSGVALDVVTSRVKTFRDLGSFVLAILGTKLTVAMAGIIGILVVSRWEKRARELLQTSLLIFLPLLPLLFVQTLFLRTGPAYGVAFEDKPPASTLSQRPYKARVLWIVFDELDQRVAFRDRPKGLELPELDRFRGTAFYAQQAETVGTETEASIPSLLTGRIVKATERKHPSDLLVTFEGASGPLRWSEQPTVFSEARKAGIDSALVGTFHPYCRIFADLTSCSWTPAIFVAGNTPEYMEVLPLHQKALFYLEVPLRRARFIGKFLPNQQTQSRHKAIFSYRSVAESVSRIASDTQFGLVFMHWPIPHPPGIYDRRLKALSESSDTGYLDNLALVDKTIGDLRRELEAAGLWEETTILITSDHGLRDWSKLEAGQGGEPFASFFRGPSQEVPFVLKLSNQSQEFTYERPFSVVQTKQLILAILKGQVSNAHSVAEWLDKGRAK